MSKINMSILVISLIVVLSCCSNLFPDEKLSIIRTDYNGSQLRVNGYYYLYNQNPESTQILFLYRNGVLLITRFFPSHDLGSIEKTMLNEYDEMKKEKTRWGVFMIYNNRIEYERWNGTTGIGLPTIKCKGTIENDTTFRITETYYSDSKETDYVEFIWHFKQFNNKPDSTSVYIK